MKNIVANPAEPPMIIMDCLKFSGTVANALKGAKIRLRIAAPPKVVIIWKMYFLTLSQRFHLANSLCIIKDEMKNDKKITDNKYWVLPRESSLIIPNFSAVAKIVSTSVKYTRIRAVL